MTLNQILYFQKVARLENYHYAAEELYVSQPSLSRSMASLESELGVALFEKKGRGVNLTKAGKLFLEYAERILEDCKIAMDKMQELATDGGRIDIGYVFPLAGHYIPHMVKQFLNRKENQNVVFSFLQNHTSAIADKVKSGELDVGFGGCQDRDDMEYFPVVNQEMVIITQRSTRSQAPNICRLLCWSSIRSSAYEQASWLGTHTRCFYQNSNLSPNIIMECPDEYSIVALVRENFGIAFIPRTDILDEAAGVSIHQIEGVELFHQIFMFWMKDRYRLPAVDRFITYMKEQAETRTDSENALKRYLKDIVNFSYKDV
ncbi:MAG: LysR family transcriptional regulator [Lachnospiraceae bacterium]